jgi:hypothetical protein
MNTQVLYEINQEIKGEKLCELDKCYVCEGFAGNRCKSCCFMFCFQHLWLDLCYKCLKESLYPSELRKPHNQLISELHELRVQKFERKLGIKECEKKISKLNIKFKTLSISNQETLKQKTKKEIKSNKTLAITAEKLKKALKDLKKSEKLVNDNLIQVANDLEFETNDLDALKKNESILLSQIDSIKIELRKSIHYPSLRNLICNDCSFKVKSGFKDQILRSLSKGSSMIGSLVAAKLSVKSLPEYSSKDSCKCLIM